MTAIVDHNEIYRMGSDRSLMYGIRIINHGRNNAYLPAVPTIEIAASS